MQVHGLSARGFRNLAGITLLPHPRFNVLSGENGQGKTNILEAIYLIATLRSFRTLRTEELIQFGEPNAELRARVQHRDVQRALGVRLETRPTKKVALVDGKQASGSEYFGAVNVVLFAPEDLRLPKGPPVGRRRFLDRAIWNTLPAYLDEVRTYDRVLRSRNALLRQDLRSALDKRRHAHTHADAAAQQAAAGDGVHVELGADGAADGAGGPVTASATAAVALPSSLDLLDIFDEKLADAGAVLMRRRHAYVRELLPEACAAFAEVSRSGLPIDLRYQPGVSASQREAALAVAEDPRGLRALLLEQLKRDRRRDLIRGYTHSGPHADDLALDLDGRPADQHASQGQLRAIVLSLKIAEIQHLGRHLGDPPVLLLDDVSSELDPQRNGYLFEFLRSVPCQVFITTTSPSFVQLGTPQGGDGDSDRRDYQVVAGQVEPTGPMH
ncbi:MAG: DNA replication/repair protein RecF [Polyangia bacterium]